MVKCRYGLTNSKSGQGGPLTARAGLGWSYHRVTEVWPWLLPINKASPWRPLIRPEIAQRQPTQRAVKTPGRAGSRPLPGANALCIIVSGAFVSDSKGALGVSRGREYSVPWPDAQGLLPWGTTASRSPQICSSVVSRAPCSSLPCIYSSLPWPF